jgi:hypothetical protein
MTVKDGRRLPGADARMPRHPKRDGLEKAAEAFVRARSDVKDVFVSVTAGVDGAYVLQLEIDDGVVALRWPTKRVMYYAALLQADRLDRILMKAGVRPHHTRAAWLAHLAQRRAGASGSGQASAATSGGVEPHRVSDSTTDPHATAISAAQREALDWTVDQKLDYLVALPWTFRTSRYREIDDVSGEEQLGQYWRCVDELPGTLAIADTEAELAPAMALTLRRYFRVALRFRHHIPLPAGATLPWLPPGLEPSGSGRPDPVDGE